MKRILVLALLLTSSTAYGQAGRISPQGGTITAVTAGNGLTGGGTSGAVTVNVVCTTGIICNADNIAIDTSVIATGVLSANVIPKSNGTSWVASSFIDNGSNVQTSLSMFIGIDVGTSTKLVNVGRDTSLTTAVQNGFQINTFSDGNNYVDSKTYASGFTHFRAGAGAESGAARTWMTVDNDDGNVGHGDPTPTNRLTVQGAISGTSGVYLNEARTVGINESGGIFQVRTNNLDAQMTVDADGDLGVKRLLEVFTPNTTVPVIRMGRTAASTAWGIGHSPFDTDFSVNYFNGTSWLEDMFQIANDGDVQIGVSNTNTATLTIAGTSAADEQKLVFDAGDGSDRFYFETDLDASTPNDLLVLRDVNTDNNMVWKGDGKVFMGVSATSGTLQGETQFLVSEASGDSAITVQVRGEDRDVFMGVDETNNYARIGTTINQPLVLRTSNADRITIDGAGATTLRTAVGTSVTTTTSFTVDDTTALATGVGGAILLSGQVNTAGPVHNIGAVIKASKTNGNNADNSFDLQLGTRLNGGSVTERVRVTNQGLVGIGTPGITPDALLHVRAGASGAASVITSTVLSIENSGDMGISIRGPTNNYKAIFFANPTSAADGGIMYDDNANGFARGFQFRTGGNITRMTIDLNGVVMDSRSVGTTLSGSLINSIFRDQTSMAQGVGGALRFDGNSTGTTPTSAAVIKAMKATATNNEESFDLAIGTRFETTSDVTERVRVSSSGTLNALSYAVANGASGVGSAPEISNFFSSGDYRNLIFYREASDLGNGTVTNNSSWGEVEYGSTLVYVASTDVPSPRGTVWGTGDSIGKLTCTDGGTACSAGGSDYRYVMTSASTFNNDVRNETWTFSVWLRSASGTMAPALQIARYNDNEPVGVVCSGVTSTTWTRCRVTTTFTSTSFADNSEVRVYIQPFGTTALYMWGSQVEKVIGTNYMTPYVMLDDVDVASFATFPLGIGGGGTYSPGGGGSNDGSFDYTTRAISLAVGSTAGGLGQYFAVNNRGAVAINAFASESSLLITENETGVAGNTSMINVALTGSQNASASARQTYGLFVSNATTRSAGANDVTAYGAYLSATSNTGVTPIAAYMTVGTSSGIATALSGTIAVFEQANGLAGWVQFRCNTQCGLAWAGQSSGKDGEVAYDQSTNLMEFRTAAIARFDINGSGQILAGDTSGTDVGNNLDVMLIGQTGTGQTGATKSVLKIDNSGTYDTTAGDMNQFGIRVTMTSSRSAGSNLLQNIAGSFDATGAQTNIALATLAGDVVFNSTSGGVFFTNGPSGINKYTGKHLEWQDDFIGRARGISCDTVYISSIYFCAGTGTGNDITELTVSGRPGVVALQTGTTTTGSVQFTAHAQAVNFSDGNWTLEASVEFPTLSNSTERYQAIVGFSDTNQAVNPTDGCWFQYDEGDVSTNPNTGDTGGISGDNWAIWCASNGTRTGYELDGTASEDSFTTVNSPVSAATWYRPRIVMEGTSKARFYLGDTEVGRITTNIPSGTTRASGANVLIVKSAGTTERSMDLDQIRVAVDLTTPRT